VSDPTLSVIVVCYNMQRELPRALRSLSREYQQHIADLDYEVLVMDNGSRTPLDTGTVEAFGPGFHYHYLADPPPSPAFAINEGVRRSRGSILCLMIDGAHILTPGALDKALRCFRAWDNAVVGLRYFFLGPDQQNRSITEGYCQAVEDGLLASIDWPGEGYRLFEIGVPLRFPGERQSTWFNKIIESNCLFLRRETFVDIDGCDERFDFPGGGFVNIDLFKRAADHPDTTLVLLVGEGSFHQVHGGTTTNVSAGERDAEVAHYVRQYREIHGSDFRATASEFHFLGNIPTEAAKIHRRRYDD